MYTAFNNLSITVNVLKFKHFIPELIFFYLNLLFLQLFLILILSGMANSVDPDQTAPDGAV